MREGTGNRMMTSDAGLNRQTDCEDSQEALPPLTHEEFWQVLDMAFGMLSDVWDCKERQQDGLAGNSELTEEKQ